MSMWRYSALWIIVGHTLFVEIGHLCPTAILQSLLPTVKTLAHLRGRGTHWLLFMAHLNGDNRFFIILWVLLILLALRVTSLHLIVADHLFKNFIHFWGLKVWSCFCEGAHITCSCEGWDLCQRTFLVWGHNFTSLCEFKGTLMV